MPSNLRRSALSSSALLHPVFLASLAVLAVNDHVLKGAGVLPTSVTGKLSDVAGLVVAPALVIFAARVRGERGIVASHALVGLAYVGLEVSQTLTAWWRALLAPLGVGWQSTADMTDLLALPVLVASAAWHLARRDAAPPPAGRPRAAAGPAEGLVAVGAAMACIATSDVPPDAGNDWDFDGVARPFDCDDLRADVFPGAVEVPGNGVDEDCDGEDLALEACEGGVDDDDDGLVDCDDDACARVCAACAAAESIGVGKHASESREDFTQLSVQCGAVNATRAFVFEPPTERGVLTVRVDDGGAHVLSVRESCFDESSEVSCDLPPVVDQIVTEGPLTLVFGSGIGAAPFEFELRWTPIVCGDGVVAPMEACDDGNLAPGDGCDERCDAEG